MLVSDAHWEQDLKRLSRVHSSRAGINSEPKWTGSMKSLPRGAAVQQRSIWSSSSTESKAASRKGKTEN